jgi:8-amino-7-oxononanoate synthase
MIAPAWSTMIDTRMQSIIEQNLQRKLKVIEAACQPKLIYQGNEMLNLSSNNYLGLASHPEIIAAIKEATKRGAGATASRYIIGHDETCAQLEQEIAQFHQKEAALLFANGYMANLGVLSALLQRGDAVFSDHLNHASIVDGIRLSGAKLYRYRHNDLDDLEKRLKKAEQAGIKRKLIVTDAVFSMDGDQAHLPELIHLKEKYGAALFVDEAHSGGVFSLEGQGLAHHLGLHSHIDLHMGTFGKAFGVYGAYVVGSVKWINYLIQTSRSLIYTTGLPPAIIGGIRKSLQLVRQAAPLRQSLHQKSSYIRKQLQSVGFQIGPSTTQIIPLWLGDEQIALAFSKRLEQEGIMVIAIRPPTVPKGTARLRLSVMANHDWSDLRYAVEVIAQIGQEMGVI